MTAIVIHFAVAKLASEFRGVELEYRHAAAARAADRIGDRAFGRALLRFIVSARDIQRRLERAA